MKSINGTNAITLKCPIVDLSSVHAQVHVVINNCFQFGSYFKKTAAIISERRKIRNITIIILYSFFNNVNNAYHLISMLSILRLKFNIKVLRV